MSLLQAAWALFRTRDASMTQRSRELVDFLGRVGLFEGMSRRDLTLLARVVHERDCADGEYLCEAGRPGASLFIVRRGAVEVLRRDAGSGDVPIAVLEPAASFDEAAAIGRSVASPFCIRARGPVSLVSLCQSDVAALSADFPEVGNRLVIRLATIVAARLQMLIDAQTLGRADRRLHRASSSA